MSSVAFETVNVAPVLTGFLDAAHAWMLTPFGNLTVDWTKNGGNVNIAVGVPVGITATVTIPGAQVLEGGKPLLNNEGVTVMGTNDQGTQIHVGSGMYSFSSLAK